MPTPSDPLKYPAHYPPTDKWKKFFIGVRWLGPDLSFFENLKVQQAARTAEQMNIWGGGLRQDIAETIAYIFQKRLRWVSGVFLPHDQFSVMCGGPQFDILDDYALEEAIQTLERKFRINIPTSFWAGLEEASFGKVVDKISKLKD